MVLKKLPVSLVLSLALLFVINILSSAFFPSIGMTYVRIPFNILLVLFISFRLEIPYMSLLVLIIQIFHSAFTLEGWAHGTFTGVVLVLIITTIRNSINFSTPLATVLAVQAFQLLWFGLLSALIYLKMGNSDYLIQRFWAFLPESMILAILSPLLFKLLDWIWNFKETGPKMGD